jgi:hypothetical protein
MKKEKTTKKYNLNKERRKKEEKKGNDLREKKATI